jgi:hypothetical protein
MEFHPICEIFPKMSDQEFLDLIQDIAENGQIETIKTYQGKIIDGRNRYLACERLNIEPKFIEWTGEGSLFSYVMSLNLHRRHLTASQKAVIGEEMLPFYEEEAKERQRLSQGQGIKGSEIIPSLKSKAAEQVAKVVGVNPHYIQDVKKIRQETPELIEHIKDGTLTIPEAKVIARDFQLEERPAIIQKFKDIDSGEKKPKVLELVGERKKEEKKVDPRPLEIKEYDEYIDKCNKIADEFREAIYPLVLLDVEDDILDCWSEFLNSKDIIQTNIDNMEIILSKVLKIKKFLRGLKK